MWLRKKNRKFVSSSRLLWLCCLIVLFSIDIDIATHLWQTNLQRVSKRIFLIEKETVRLCKKKNKMDVSMREHAESFSKNFDKYFILKKFEFVYSAFHTDQFVECGCRTPFTHEFRTQVKS